MVVNGFVICISAYYKLDARRELLRVQKDLVLMDLTSEAKRKADLVKVDIGRLNQEVTEYVLAGMLSAFAGAGLLWLRWFKQPREAVRAARPSGSRSLAMPRRKP